MSTQLEPDSDLLGAPELTSLGKRIEMLRIERGLSKQHLARHAGTSRQQLWRVMTGKSELSSPLRQRLTDVLGVDVAGPMLPTSALPDRPIPPAPGAELPVELHRYLAQPRRIEATLRSLPIGNAGRRLKRALLDMLETLAAEHRIPLTPAFAELRRKVLNGDL